MPNTPEAPQSSPEAPHGPPDASLVRAGEILGGASSLFVLTGAGVSAESGVPTFRDAQTGLWARFDPQVLASPEGFAENPGMVWSWYMSRLAGVEAARPNAGHAALVRLGERFGERFALFTQNVDDLHERAGSPRVSHLHGSIARFHCRDCAASYALCPPRHGVASRGLERCLSRGRHVRSGPPGGRPPLRGPARGKTGHRGEPPAYADHRDRHGVSARTERRDAAAASLAPRGGDLKGRQRHARAR